TPPAPASSTLHASKGSLHGMRTTGGNPSAWYVWHRYDSVCRSSGMCSVSTKTKSIPVCLASAGHCGEMPTMAEANTRRPSCNRSMISRPFMVLSSCPLDDLSRPTRLQRRLDGGEDGVAGADAEDCLAARLDGPRQVVGQPEIVVVGDAAAARLLGR